MARRLRRDGKEEGEGWRRPARRHESVPSARLGHRSTEPSGRYDAGALSLPARPPRWQVRRSQPDLWLPPAAPALPEHLGGATPRAGAYACGCSDRGCAAGSGHRLRSNRLRLRLRNLSCHRNGADPGVVPGGHSWASRIESGRGRPACDQPIGEQKLARRSRRRWISRGDSSRR